MSCVRSERSSGWCGRRSPLPKWVLAGALAAAPLLLLPDVAAGAAPPPAPASGATPPTYTNYPAPAPLATSAGEPSLSYDAKSGNVMFEAGLQTLRVSFDDSTSPARATWTDVSYILTSMVTLDPILYTERTTGRTFVSQLAGATSLMAYSDDGGVTWTPSQGAGIPAGPDHETVGGGPLPSGTLTTAGYPYAVYYCSQAIALASCAVSLDGGLTFGPAVPMYNLTQCGGLHGHIKVAPDGTAYVPNDNCGNQQGVAVTTDAGVTWTVRLVPGSNSPGASDPSVAVATDGTLYFGFADGSGHPAVGVSHDRGQTWTNVWDVGASLGIQNTAFPAMVAGDPARAAFAFLGT
ncbi:MAG: exo-alpha-sialidase, partial [Acidobacteria bacterium]|nr:exo-alpha-sialidase [Acidobacteriota bacterium]